MPLRKWVDSTGFAIEGILYAARTQRHLRYHLYTAAFVLLLSYVLGLTRTDFLIIAIAVILVLIAEMINTAIEYVVDLLSPELNESARIAKDVAAGAVLITAFGAAVIGYIILFPYFSAEFQRGLHIAKHSKEEITLIATILVLITVIVLKSYFGKGQPFRGGMPSGHAALAFSVWVAITYSTESFAASLLSFALAAIIAQSRVTVRAHNPYEVIAGAVLGAGLTLLLFFIFY
ncbi:MAG: diacylglycerol kinase [Nitrospirae bacterium]|nr:diacylglycerol kinase [Nitrospirota bacterium]